MNYVDHQEIQRRYIPIEDPSILAKLHKDDIENKRLESESRMSRIINTAQLCTGVIIHVKTYPSGDLNFAFIKPDDAYIDDIFVHHNEIEPWRSGFKTLDKGDRVKFKIDYARDKDGKVVNNNKLQARNLEVVRGRG